MDTVELQWPSRLSAPLPARRGFGGASHSKFVTFTPLSNWQSAEEGLTGLEKTLGPSSVKKEAQDLRLTPSEGTQSALKEELKLEISPSKRLAKRAKRKASDGEDSPDRTRRQQQQPPLSVFAKKNLKTP